jgi:hypothetical protein
MPLDTLSAPVSKRRLWAGWVMSALPALFLLVDGAMKLVKPEVVVETTMDLGYAETVILPLGVVLLICTTLYLNPRTAVLGAILLTGYLRRRSDSSARRARAVRNRVPAVLGALLWGGLALRDDRLRTLIPLRD